MLDRESISSRLLLPATAAGGGDSGTAKTKIAFFFEYGIVVFWGLTPKEERTAMRELVSTCELDPLPVTSIEVDSFFFTFSDPSEMTYRPSPSPSFDEGEHSGEMDGRGGEGDGDGEASGVAAVGAGRSVGTALATVLAPGASAATKLAAAASPSSTPRAPPPRMMPGPAATALGGFGSSSSTAATAAAAPGERSRVADDVVIIPPEQRGDAAIMLAASHSLAQSTKLALYEANAARLVERTEYIPGQMANDGELSLSMKDATKLRGQIFLQRADLNLLSTVLDVPDFFWGVPDRYCRLYEEMRVYLELDTRVEVLNRRLNVMESLAAAVNQELEYKNSSRLEWIVIW